MSTSKHKEIPGRAGRAYLWATLFCILLSTVYESFSHEVYSPWMVCLFLYPLLLGVVPFGIFHVQERLRVGEAAMSLWGCGVATFACGSLMVGIMEIYGSKAPFAPYYWTVGSLLFAAAAAAHVLGKTPAAR